MERGRRNSRIRILKEIEEKPGSSVSEIARRLGYAKSTVSVVTQRLEKEGLISRIKKGGAILLYPRREENKSYLRLGLIRAAEYPFVIGFYKRMKELGYHVDIVVYRNGLEATMDLVSGRIDLALTPLPTQFLLGSLSGKIIIVGGGAYGGSAVVRAERGDEVVATTMASAMEACSNMFFGKRIEKIYANSGDEVLDILGRKARYAVIWEPYLSIAVRRGARVEAYCSELGASYCCTLGARRSLSPSILGKIVPVYRESVLEQARNPLKWVEAYSRIVGMSSEIIKRAINSYAFNPEIEVGEAEKMLTRGGLKVPSPSVIRSLVLV